jgi:hypothetical protein
MPAVMCHLQMLHCGNWLENKMRFQREIYALRRFHCEIYALRRFRCKIYALRSFTAKSTHCGGFTVKSTHCGGFNMKSTHCGGFTAKSTHCGGFTVKTTEIVRMSTREIYAVRRFLIPTPRWAQCVTSQIKQRKQVCVVYKYVSVAASSPS